MMIHCRIVTPKGIYREMDTEILNIETTDGQQGILPNHMPLVTMLKIGKLSTIENSQRQEYAIAGGLFYLRENQAEILTDAIEHQSEIDVNRAEQSKSRAENRLSHPDENLDLDRARISLQRALNRLTISGRS